MAYLVPDKVSTFNGVPVKEYLLTKHNPNRIDMPIGKITDLVGITVHNTQSISVGSGTTMAEQYSRATANGNMGDVRVHFYIDDKEAWQNLPLDLQGWHAANSTGNAKTISIECIMDAPSGARNEKAEDNCARLVAYLLDKYKMTTANVYSHSHWYNGKTCPLYILPHWNSFLKLVEKYMDNSKPIVTQKLYRIRKSWDDVSSQIGAYANLDSAKSICTDGYFVFDSEGVLVYPIVQEKEVPPTLDLPTLRKGDKGSRVKAVQALLLGYGYSLDSYGADGLFGAVTEAVVRKYQRENGLTEDGIVGANTWNKLLGG